MNEIKFKITNITCEACIKISKKSLQTIPGVRNIEIGHDGQVIVLSDDIIEWNVIVDNLKNVDKRVELN